jgi:hypothetical protein
MENLIYVFILLLMLAILILEGKIKKERTKNDSELYRLYRLIKEEFHLYIDKHEKDLHQARDSKGKFMPKVKGE